MNLGYLKNRSLPCTGQQRVGMSVSGHSSPQLTDGADEKSGAAFWPLIFVPMTENSGRMPGYFVSLSDGTLLYILSRTVMANQVADLIYRLSDFPGSIGSGDQLRDHDHHAILRRRS